MDDVPERKVSKIVFANKTRIVILLLSIFCFTIVQSNAISANFTVICMSDVIEEQKGNSSEPHWLEVNSEVSLLFSATAVGSMIGVLPSVTLINKFGIRNVFVVYAFLSGIGTLAFPLAISFGLYPAMIPRVLQGVGTSILFTIMGAISQKWALMSELSTYLAFISVSIQLSSIITMPLAGLLCESDLGWRALYYILGSLTLVSHIMFFFFFNDSPSMHRNVSEKELRKISTGKVDQAKRGVPYRAVCADRTILGIWASVCGGNMGFMLLLYYGPTYLNKVMGMDIKNTGFATALPYVLSACVKFIAGPLSDFSTCISEKSRLVLFAAVSQLVMAFGFLVLAFTSNLLIAQIAYTSAICFSGINIVGVVKCAQLRARQYVHFVMAVISLSACTCTFILPIIVGAMCPDNTLEQWSRFYILLAIFMVVVNIPFPFFATEEPAPYTMADWVDPSVVKIEEFSKQGENAKV